MPAYDTALRLGIVAEYRERARNQWKSTDELIADQRQRRNRILEHAWDHVPFYRHRFGAMGVVRADLARDDVATSIPILRKQEVIEHQEDLVDRSDPRPLLWISTGGSTGETVRFCRDRRAGATIKAREMRFSDWIGVRDGERVARIWGSPVETAQARTWRQRLAFRLKNVLMLDGYSMTEEAMASYRSLLMRFQPKLVAGFTASLVLFAEFLEAHGAHGIRPRAVVSTASPLYPRYRELLERVFEARVFDQYGSREFGGMAHECEAHAGLHVGMEDVWVEVVEDEASSADVGGELIVTGLFNRAFPLIRYAIGDRGRYLGDACPCGRGAPLLAILGGRSSEILRGPKNIPVSGEFFIDVFDALPSEVRGFRVYQTDPLRLRLELVAPVGLSASSDAYIRRAIADKFGEEMAVEMRLVEEIPPLPSGKRLLTINQVPSLR